MAEQVGEVLPGSRKNLMKATPSLSSPWTDRQTDGRTDGQSHLSHLCFPLPNHLEQSQSPAPTPHEAGPQLLVFLWVLERGQAATDLWASSAYCLE